MNEDVRTWCERGHEALDRGDPEQAIDCYDRALEADPENPEAWCGRGKACYDLGRLRRADSDFRQGVRCARAQLGPLEGDARKARRWWADQRTRPYLRALHGRGLCRFWLGDYEAAARIFRRLLKLAPSDPLDVRFLVGETSFRMGHVDRAVREYMRAGEDPDVLYNLGLAQFYRGDFVRSVNALRRAMFENVHLAWRLSDSDAIPDVPSYRGVHPKSLDTEDAAEDYDERCGDLWAGRPLLRRWLRGIYHHPIVHAELLKHVEQIRSLADEDLDPGARARVEGENTSLRNEARLAATDRQIASEVGAALFAIRD
jgi:tetratricopeptide (TPR) repeat protein